MFYINKTRTLLIFLTTVFLCGLFIGCNEGSSGSNKVLSGDESTETIWYKDADGDGYGDPAATLTQAIQPAGYVSNSGDCADYNGAIHPGATEVCDGKDNNCSGGTDENACESESQKISGRITNLNNAQAYITKDSYLQLISYSADGQMAFTNDEEGRRVYTSDLASVDMPSDGSFIFETYGLIPGQYVIAAQRLQPYGTETDEIPILETTGNQPAIIVIPEDGDTAFEVDLGNLNLPVPAPVADVQTGLASPTGVSATDGAFEDKIRVTWNASPGATEYEVYRANSFTGQQSKIATTTGTAYDDTALPCGVDYYYWVRAKNASATSDLFYNDLGFIRCPATQDIPDEDTDDPVIEPEVPVVTEEPDVLDIPNGLSATDGLYPEKVNITWNAVNGATSYEVYRHSDCCGERTMIGTTSGTSFNDTLEDVILFSSINYYWVKAINSKTRSSYSNRDSGYKLLKPLCPTDVAASDGTYVGKIHITWKPGKYPVTDLSCDNTCGGEAMVEKVSEYEIYRSELKDQNAAKIKIGTTSSTWFDDYDIPCDTCENIYYYWVVAKNAAGSSKYCDNDSGFAYRTISDPSDIRATDGTIRYCVKIYWSAVAGAKSYDIFRSTSLDGTKTKLGSILADCGNCGSYTYLDTNPVCPEIYYYWVKSVDINGHTSCKCYFHDTGYCGGD